ncbi:FAD-binding oxidoreductase [Tsuneonella sp. HG222]
MAESQVPGVPAALRRFAGVVGAANVFFSDDERAIYADSFAWDPERHLPGGAVCPSTVEEVQAIVRIANEEKAPLWPISRGKNLGYGGTAPVMAGSIVLDLSRMKKIEVDQVNGTVLLEPGVGFFDLYDYLQSNKIPLWLSVPGNSWGSVAGNALDRGVGYTTYGDHASRICGLEVVLADGSLVRTGTGGISNSATWQLYKPGYGPSWDTMFTQSNFGVVTKLGLWLMPEPEGMAGFDIEAEGEGDLVWLVDTLAKLRRDNVIQQTPSIGNWLRAAAPLTTRADWGEPGKPLGASAIDAIRKRFNIGWWSVSTRYYGPVEIVDATQKVVERAFAGTGARLTPSRWVKGQAPEGSPWTGVPVTFPLANANWFGGRGGHIGFSPVMPPSGALAMRETQKAKALFDEMGFDYHPSFAMGERHMTNVNQILFNKDDAQMTAKVDLLLRKLVSEAAKQGFTEYRAHIEYMDLVASTFDYNDQALRRLNERVKDALDPNGIIAPGKSGIRSAAQRGVQA